MVDMGVLAITFDFIGKVLIAAMALLVHAKIIKEHKIDRKVLSEMHLEEIMGVTGIILITLGYIIKLQYI